MRHLLERHERLADLAVYARVHAGVETPHDGINEEQPCLIVADDLFNAVNVPRDREGALYAVVALPGVQDPDAGHVGAGGNEARHDRIFGLVFWRQQDHIHGGARFRLAGEALATCQACRDPDADQTLPESAIAGHVHELAPGESALPEPVKRLWRDI